MNFFDREKAKEFEAIEFRNQRRNLRQLKQTKTKDLDVVRDKERKALLSGKRISKNGNTYWETR
jgi:hypothetical protein